MQIPPQIIDQVREGADILNIIQDYVQIKKVGANYVGLCPFHEEKTPSFNVNPLKGYFKCFGCGKGGNVITFVMEIERLDFPDAVRWLADRMGIEIPDHPTDQEHFKKKEVVYSALRFAAEYFVRQLQEPVSGLHAREYLKQRGLSEKTIQRYQLGYAPDSWDGLLKEATSGHIKPEVLSRAGLVVQRDDGRCYDRFRGRIIFPVWSHTGKIIGFGGRILKEKQEHSPKYLNSPETEVYHKSYVLYGLYQAKREARERKQIVLVEGYTDVLALDEAGIAAVACCGTALTSEQVRLLGRFVKEIYLLYDADSAGIAATKRAIDTVLQGGLTPSVVQLPKGEDPDSFVRAQGADQFQTYLRTEVKDWINTMYHVAVENNMLNTIQSKREEISRIATRISWIQDQTLRNMYIQEVQRLFGVSEADLVRDVSSASRGMQNPEQSPEQPPRQAPVVDQIGKAEQTLLQLMLEDGAEMIKFIQDNMNPEEFQQGSSRELANALFNLYKEFKEETITAIQGGRLQISEPTLRLVADLSMHQHQISEGWKRSKIAVPKLNQDPMRTASDCMRAIKKKAIRIQIKELQVKILTSDSGSESQFHLQEEYRQKQEILRNLDKPTAFL